MTFNRSFSSISICGSFLLDSSGSGNLPEMFPKIGTKSLKFASASASRTRCLKYFNNEKKYFPKKSSLLAHSSTRRNRDGFDPSVEQREPECEYQATRDTSGEMCHTLTFQQRSPDQDSVVQLFNEAHLNSSHHADPGIAKANNGIGSWFEDTQMSLVVQATSSSNPSSHALQTQERRSNLDDFCYTSRRSTIIASVCLTECLLMTSDSHASGGGDRGVSVSTNTVDVARKSEVEAMNIHKKTITTPQGGKMYDVMHAESGYPGLIYTPPKFKSENDGEKKLPLLVILHGAGKNEENVWNLANPRGEHAGLAPSLLASGQAPPELAQNFVVAAPYSYKKQSFYNDSRSDLLKYIKWLQEDDESGVSHLVDPKRVFLFGFSDGSTVGVELMFTRRFLGGVFAAYGFTGQFPARALELLKDLNMWVFHSKDDVIFPVRCSDNLVASLRKVNSRPETVRYTRYDKDQEGFTGSVKGHSTGITASKLPEIYEWMLNL